LSGNKLAALGSLLLALAWLLPLSSLCGPLAWLGTYVIILSLCNDKPASYLDYLVYAAIGHAIAFYWLAPAIQDLSELGFLGVFGFFVLFSLYQSLEFLGFVFLFRNLPNFVDKFSLRSALAWVAIEVIPFRLFPWRLGDLQIGIEWFAQLAEIGGVSFLSLLMFWFCEALYQVFSGKRNLKYGILPGSILVFALTFGYIRIHQFSNLNDRTLSVVSVQSAVGLLDTDIRPVSPEQTISRLIELTESAKSDNTELVIWPESALPFDLHESIYNVHREPRLPKMPFHLLVGSETYRYPDKNFNSAVFIKPDGVVPLPYHKKVLIPFGEYIPLKNVFPWLAYVHRISKELSVGTESKIFEVSIPRSGKKVKISPVICFEDVLPSLSRDAVVNGAEVLISISNDAWLKKEWGAVAHYQHHMLAAFRSIENRRTLIRVGNTGLTSIISPTGRVLDSLPLHQEGALKSVVPVIREITIYSYCGQILWYALSAIVLVMVIVNKFCQWT
jgi:apolipoprotein N-acyltransferase